MEEARQQQAATVTEFNWLGHRFPINNAKTRVSILKGSYLVSFIHHFALCAYLNYQVC
jgi:signal recognition particle subunit SRP68